MGQKMDPHGLRVGIIKDWDSKWYANKKDIAEYLVEDYKIRAEVKKRLFVAGISKVEIERTEISSTTIKEPVNKIVEVRTVQVTSRGSGERVATSNPALTASTTLAKKVQGITPTVRTLNTSAYCACMKCCGKTNGITASGAKATQWYTVAAGKGYKMGTVIYIPALKDKPNGGWFVVQDRGGAISNSKLDIYMNSHSGALQYGRRNLEAYIYEF